MREMTFEEIRQVQIDLLQDVDSFCRANDINYSLGEGTLIGAVRHNGFIPWDDDIDIIMLRRDYEKFLSLYQSERFVIKQYDTDLCKWMWCYKVVDPQTAYYPNGSDRSPFGIWLTVFPIDNAPDDEEEFVSWSKRKNFYMRLFLARCFKWKKQHGFIWNMPRLCLHFILSVFPIDYWHNRAEREMKKYENVVTHRRCLATAWFHLPWNCASESFDECMDVPFEHLTLRIIKGYDDYLKCQYGDYMQLPPEEERIPKHDYKAYFIE